MRLSRLVGPLKRRYPASWYRKGISIVQLVKAEVKTIGYWFQLRRRRVTLFAEFGEWITPSLTELAFNIVVPVTYKWLGRRQIKSIENVGTNLLKVSFRGVSNSLFIPRWALKQLLQVISEQTFPLHWDRSQYAGVRLEARDSVVECGAGEGFFSLVASKIAKKVYAIEPLPAFYRCLVRTFDGADNVEIFPFALGSQSGRMTLYEDGIRSRLANNDKGILISVKRLDDLLWNKEVTFIKIDVEGMEKDVLLGAAYIISKQKPKLFIATYHDSNDPLELAQLLKALNSDYKIVFRGINYKNGLPKAIFAW